MAKQIYKTLGMAAGLTSALVFTGMSSQAFAMSPFQASYQFIYNGKNMGSATRTLSKSGNNWTYVFYINGKKVGENSKIELTAGDEITVKAIVTDNDKSPDVGTNNSKHTVTEKEIKDGFTISLNVKVRENKGRYTGNTATWKISYKFTPSK